MDRRIEQARDAYAQYRWDDAYRLLTAARESDGLDDGDLAMLSDAAWWLGRIDESLTLSEEAYRRCLHNDDKRQAANLAVSVGFLWLLRGEPTVGSGWLNRANRLLDDMPECAVHGYLLYLRAAEATAQGRFDDAVEIARHIQRLAVHDDDRTLFAISLVVEGVAIVKQGNVGGGLATLDEAMLPVRVGEVDAVWAGNLYCELMGLFTELSDIRRARDWTTSTQRWCDEHGNPAMYQGICRVHRAQLLGMEGEWGDAEQHAEQVVRDLADMNVGVVAEGHYVIGDLYRLRGEHLHAEEAYHRASELARDPQPGLALLRLVQGRGGEAGRALNVALANTNQPLNRAPLLAAQVEVAAASADADMAREAADELVQVAKAYNTSGLIATARQAAGTARLVCGEAERALPLLRDAVRRWRELDFPYQAARARCLLARALDAVGDMDAANREVELAAAVYHRLGAPDALRELDQPSPTSLNEPVDQGCLSSRETEVLACVATGMANRSIAHELVISERTVERHVGNIFRKLDVSSRTEAARYAFEHGIVGRSDS